VTCLLPVAYSCVLSLARASCPASRSYHLQLLQRQLENLLSRRDKELILIIEDQA
jgi:hypothetical protein